MQSLENNVFTIIFEIVNPSEKEILERLKAVHSKVYILYGTESSATPSTGSACADFHRKECVKTRQIVDDYYKFANLNFSGQSARN